MRYYFPNRLVLTCTQRHDGNRRSCTIIFTVLGYAILPFVNIRQFLFTVKFTDARPRFNFNN